MLEWVKSIDKLSLLERTFEELLLISDTAEWESSVANLASAYYCASRNYHSADIRFEEAIKPLIGKYNRENLIVLLEKIEGNNQLYDRNAAKMDHRLIKERCDEILGHNYDYQEFPNFINSFQ